LHNAIKNNSAKGKSVSSKEKQTQATVLKTHKEIESILQRGVDMFKTQYFIMLGDEAPQSQKKRLF